MLVGDVQYKGTPCKISYFKAELPLMPHESIAVSSCAKSRTEATNAIVKYLRDKMNDEIVFYDVEGDNYIVYAEGANYPDILSSDAYHAKGRVA